MSCWNYVANQQIVAYRPTKNGFEVYYYRGEQPNQIPDLTPFLTEKLIQFLRREARKRQWEITNLSEFGLGK